MPSENSVDTTQRITDISDFSKELLVEGILLQDDELLLIIDEDTTVHILASQEVDREKDYKIKILNLGPEENIKIIEPPDEPKLLEEELEDEEA